LPQRNFQQIRKNYQQLRNKNKKKFGRKRRPRQKIGFFELTFGKDAIFKFGDCQFEEEGDGQVDETKKDFGQRAAGCT
jgi:hypothetical protein